MKFLPPANRSKRPAHKGRARKGDGSIRLRGNTWWYRIPNPVPGLAPLEGSCKTSDRAEAILVKNRAILESREPAAVPTSVPATVGEILDDYYEEQVTKAEHKERTDPEVDSSRYVANLRSSIAILKQHLGDVPAASLTSEHTMRFRRAREKTDGVLFTTVNQNLRWLRAALHRAMRVTPPKATFVPHMFMPPEKSRIRQGFVERDGQYEQVLAACPPSLRALWICGFHVGARANELKRMRWDRVDFARGIIEIPARTAKTGVGRTVPIWGDMTETLKWQKEIRDRLYPFCPHVFFWHDGQNAGQKIIDHADAFKKVFAAAGCPNLIFHDLRRSAIKYAIQEAGIDNTIVRHMSGHKTDTNLMRYNISSTREMEELGRRLNQSLKKHKSPAAVIPIRKQA